METEETECFICDNILTKSEVIVVKEKGLETFRQSSLKRKYGKVKFLRGKTSIAVHNGCRKRYNNEKLIAAYLRRGGEASSSTVQRRSAEVQFSFRDHCFLCADKITAEFLEKQKQTRLRDRKIVYNVRTSTMKDTVLQRAQLRGDEWGQAIVKRLEGVIDLVAADAQYHLSCMKKLYHVPLVNKKRKTGRNAEDIDAACSIFIRILKEIRMNVSFLSMT